MSGQSRFVIGARNRGCVTDPMMICGGSNLGFKHGSLCELQAGGAPLNNLYTSILNALDVATENFPTAKAS